MRAISLGYHDVVDDPKTSRTLVARTGALYTLRRQDFRNHLESLRQHGVAVRALERFRRWENETPVFLTFDDGALSAYSCVADELERQNWRGHFFVTSNWIGRPGFLGARHIRELHERGHVIGSHSCSHPARMSHLGWEELLREWCESCAALGEIIGQPVKVASVAHGYYSHKVGRAAAAANLEVLFTSEPTAAISWVDGCLILGRYAIRRNTPPSVAGAIAAGANWPRWQQAALWSAKKVVKRVTGQGYRAVRELLVSRRSLPLNPD